MSEQHEIFLYFTIAARPARHGVHEVKLRVQNFRATGWRNWLNIGVLEWARRLKTGFTATAAARWSDQAMQDVELTILLPCLDEAETLAVCIRKAISFMRETGIKGEVLVADNGSKDGSQEIAAREGARVVPVLKRGYGAALQGGIAAAHGRYVIMGDADDSYDFSQLGGFVAALRAGAILVMGNRFLGGIEPGAMPFLHRYLGNPVLSYLGRLFFRANIHDFHCGLRGFDRSAILALDLRTTGMEFASELVVRSVLAGYPVVEVPTRLSRDGRSRPPHLRTWRDGWRHLRFLLLYSPKWLFLYPGLALIVLGLIGAFALGSGSVRIGEVSFDVHTFLVACAAILLGLQSISFAAVARRYATIQGFIPASPRFASFLDALTLERVLAASVVLLVIGFAGLVWCVFEWAAEGFGPITYASIMRILVLSLTAFAAGLQMAMTAFLSSVMEISVNK
jgi:glycosyltransferase involved in cell wall biosynthesis